MTTAVAASTVDLHQQLMEVVTEVETTRAMSVERPGKRKHSEVDVADTDLGVDHVGPSAVKRTHTRSASMANTAIGADDDCHGSGSSDSTNGNNNNSNSGSSNNNIAAESTNLIAMDTASLSSRVSSTEHTMPLASQDTDKICESTLRMRPIQQGIRRQRRPSSLRSRDGIGALMPAPAGGPLTPLTLCPPASATAATIAATIERESTLNATASLENEEAPWLDVDRNVRKMDETFDASFHAWLRNEANVWVSAGYLQRLAIEYPAERTARALAWLADGWSVRSAAVLARVVTLRWCLAAGMASQSTTPASSTTTSFSEKLFKQQHQQHHHQQQQQHHHHQQQQQQHSSSSALHLSDAATVSGPPSVQRCCHLCCASTTAAYPPTPTTATTPTTASMPIMAASSDTGYLNTMIVSDLTRSHQLRGVAKVICAITRSYAPRDVGRLLTAAYGDLDAPRLQALVELVGVGWPANDFAVLVSSLGDPVPANVRLALLDRVRHTLSIERITTTAAAIIPTPATASTNPTARSIRHRSMANAMAANRTAAIATANATATANNPSSSRPLNALHIHTAATSFANQSIPPAPRSAPLLGRMEVSSTSL